MTKTTEPMLPAVARSSGGLRDALFDEIDAIRNGTGNPTRANAVAKLAGTVVETVRMELEVQRFAATADGRSRAAQAVDAPLKSLALGA